MNGNVVSFQSVIENGMIRQPEVYRETFTTPVLVTVREDKKEERLSSEEITARLNEIYKDAPAVIDDDIMLMQYNLVGESDW
jgi:hypothetical protein